PASARGDPSSVRGGPGSATEAPESTTADASASLPVGGSSVPQLNSRHEIPKHKLEIPKHRPEIPKRRPEIPKRRTVTRMPEPYPDPLIPSMAEEYALHMQKQVVLSLIALCLGSCAQTVEDIDRTQPNKVHKQALDGEWFLARTVIDAPYSTDFTFIGESAELERIRWDIQEDLLVGYRVYDRVEGTDRAFTFSEGPYQGSPVVAYPILKHFDIVRQYNPSTGEQTNVLEENDNDRPWYSRDFIRVDWSDNQLPSITFLVNYYASSDFAITPNTAYHTSDPTHPHAFVMGTKSSDGTWTDHRDDASIRTITDADYLETTIRMSVGPSMLEFEDYYGGLWSNPACWWYLNADCEHQNIVVRHSFMKAPTAEESHYEPLAYPDTELARTSDGQVLKGLRDANGDVVADEAGVPIRYEMFDKFGFFRTERYGYDPVYGELESNRIYYINRFDIWDANGEAQPIVYYKSPDWPAWLDEEGRNIADQYDVLFKELVTSSGKTPPARMFELRENSGQRIGDVRYSFLYYVPKPTLAGLLGYGPSLADPETGEIISASAYVYGAPIKQYAGEGQQVVDVINGFVSPEELGLGDDVARYVRDLGAAGKPGHRHDSRGELATGHLEDFVEKYVNDGRGQQVRKAGVHKLRHQSEWYRGRLAKIQGTAFEDALITPEVKRMMGAGLIGPNDAVPDKLKPHLSPLSWLPRQNRKPVRDRIQAYRRKNMYMASFVDDAVAGLALDLKDKGVKSAEALQTIEKAVFQSTAEHELGHTLGLRHNFAGSYDALNFPKRFWELQGSTPQFPPKARTPQQIAERMDEYRQSSIMEYPARFNADWQGLGHYDKAALMFGYGQLVQVFENAPTDPLANAFADEFDLRYALQDVRHYSSLPASLGGVDAMFARKYVPHSQLKAQLSGASPWTLWEVPYRFCSDEYEGATDTCSAYDAGMDPYEIVLDAADRYRNYYFFKAFKRDRAGWDGGWYYYSIYGRYFKHMLNQYQHWAFLAYDETQTWDAWREDPTFYGIEDTQWDLARDGGVARTAATRAALRFLIEVVAMPQPGGYAYDGELDRYWRWEPDPTYWPTCGPELQEKDDPEAPCLDVNITLGEGRYSFTNYNPDDGYYFYERPLWVGAFTDKILAIETLSDPTVTFLGINTAEDVQAYALGFWLYFPDILSKLSGGIIADDVNTFAGTTEFGTYYPPDPFSPKPAGRTIVDPDTWSTIQYYAMWLGMSGYSSGFDNTFNDLMHVWYDGGDGEQTVPDPDDPSVATWVDPTTQRTWRAVRHPDDKLYSPAFEMVQRAAQLQGQHDAATGNEQANYKTLISFQRELIVLSQGMWELYAKLTF
ncbi:MAG: hypothetical protein ACI9WU_000983, partial [Myxococcota bacterium]